jgi:hypothetical protein
MYDGTYLGAWDLDGRDVTFKISGVHGGEFTGQQGRKSRKPFVSFEGYEKVFLLNKTNGKIIAGLYGPKTEAWIGKLLTLFPTTTTLGSDTVDCIRVRPSVPKSQPLVLGSPPASEGR